MTELGFLMDLFLDDELPKPIRKKVAERIKEVESALTKPVFNPQPTTIQPPLNQQAQVPGIFQQSPSMQRIMAQNPDLIPVQQQAISPQPATQAAAVALQQRQAMIAEKMNQKDPDGGRKSPRKF